MEDEIDLPLYVFPEIRKHFGNRRSDMEDRIIAYEMISFLQLVFYRSDAFLRYVGMNLPDENVSNWLIDWELELFCRRERDHESDGISQQLYQCLCGYGGSRGSECGAAGEPLERYEVLDKAGYVLFDKRSAVESMLPPYNMTNRNPKAVEEYILFA